jgi:hypothetical protein
VLYRRHVCASQKGVTAVVSVAQDHGNSWPSYRHSRFECDESQLVEPTLILWRMNPIGDKAYDFG